MSSSAPVRVARPSVRHRTIAAVLVVLTAPVWIAAALMVLLSSRGPLFHRSVRIGATGQPFDMLKFRTMYVDPDRHLAAMLHQDDSRYADPRVTPVGRFLRSLHLDELPQLLNTLRGDMTITGARPLPPR